jgi:hypothetical protein
MAVSDMNNAGWCDLHMGAGAKALAVEARRMRAADTFMVGYWCIEDQQDFAMKRMKPR